ncbi:MAG: RNA polymerase-associated protein RapA [Gammaproteobacteria bacterium]
MTDECHAGQRWISSTEPELGLGIVFEVVDRRVVLTFPAGNERRTYALDNAPLTRVRYRVADRIRAEDGTELIVAGHEVINECIVYRGMTASGEEIMLHEIDLDSFVQFNRPLDRLFTGQLDRAARFVLRRETLLNQHRLRTSRVFGLNGPRVQLLPHQFFIADTVAARHAPRVLLADEVGLGKTIEAGLVTHRLLLTGRARRVLVVVPDNLVHQWLIEMLRRFNLSFSIIDADIAAELEASGETNPFETSQLALVPLSLIAGDARRLDQAAAAGWDLMIVDEAHHLAWTPAEASPAYRAVERLGAATPALLLLTATPEQLGVSGHFARLRLLDPHRYDDLERFRREEARYAEVSALVSRLLEAGGEPDEALLAEVAAYVGEDRVASVTHTDELVAELLDHHGTGRVLFRNCRDHIEGFPERRLTAHPLPLPAEYAAPDVATPATRLTPEAGFDDRWLGFDPRAEWLADWLKAHRGGKSLVICARAETAQSLEAWLRARRGIRSAVFHEGLDLVQRDRAAAYFADPEEDAEVLVCSEIGSEGRNFQFAHRLVLFDLPQNPDLLEQRIGRLDRIGQRHSVEIHVPCFEQGPTAVLLAWLHRGLDAFEHICPAAPALLAEFGDELDACLGDPGDGARVEALVAATATRRRTLVETMRAGRDRLLELNSYDRERAAAVIAAVEAAAQTAPLRAWMDQVFDQFGVEHEDNGAHSEVLRPGDHMSCEAFPGLPEGGLTVSFDRTEALSRDDMHFLTWEHPMVAGAMDLVLGSEFGNAAFGILKAGKVAAGTVLVECQFVIVCPAPRGLGVERFLDASTLRVVVDSAGEEVGERFDGTRLDAAVREVPKATAQKVVARMRDQIEQLAEHAAHLGEVRQEGIVAAARRRLGEELGAEVERLRSLARVNPNIRDDEIAALEDERAQSDGYLASAQLKLDAVRIIVTT